MKLTFLGTGGAFTMKHWHSNMLLEDGDHRLLIDCGSDIRFSLAEASIGVDTITDIYISHCHADHAGGLEYVGFKSFFANHRPKLHGHAHILDTLWNNTLKGGMGILDRQHRRLSDYFDVFAGDFWFGKLPLFCKLIRTIHIQDDIETMPSFGLMLGDRAFITTDTKLDLPNLREHYEKAPLIFQDCETYDMTGKFRSGVHAHYLDLRNFPSEIKEKMWLYHYGDEQLPNPEWNGFRGFVKKGQVFEIKEKA